MAITFVSFMRPVVFVSTGMDYWSLAESLKSNSGCAGVSVVDKGTHLLFSVKVRDKRRRIKVALTNIAHATEEEQDEPAKEKEL